MDVLTQIKAEQKAQKITNEKMAELIGSSTQVMWAWFKRKKTPRYANLLKMAEVLGCDIVLVKKS